MKKYKLILINTILSFFVSTIAIAQNLDLDVINLKHQTADEIIPIIQPFLIPEAAVTSRGYKLIIKSTPENLEQVKKIIAEVDAGLRQLTISVSIGQHSAEVENKTQAQIMAELNNNDSQLQVGSGGVSDADTVGAIVRGEKKSDNTKIATKFSSRKTTTKRSKPVHQTIRSTEGKWATIRAGQSIPIIQRTRNPDGTVTQTVRYKSATTGFKILPRVQPDNNVALYIRPHQTNVNPQGDGSFDITRMETNIIGKLGEWIPLGNLNELSNTYTTTNTGSTLRRNERNDSVSVKIEIAQ
jgi:type II secretory pathway component GspD/PulD (secretin)